MAYLTSFLRGFVAPKTGSGYTRDSRKMDIRPIHNDIIYRETLTEIEGFFDATPGTPEGDRLEVLVTLVESYERKHFPILPPDPVDAIELGAA